MASDPNVFQLPLPRHVTHGSINIGLSLPRALRAILHDRIYSKDTVRDNFSEGETTDIGLAM